MPELLAVAAGGPDVLCGRAAADAGPTLDKFGPDRLMLGPDWPVCTVAAGYADVLDVA
jgi:predicted TIM-barrel fold metal-dependent hydrolase